MQSNIGAILGQRRRRWPNIAPTLDSCTSRFSLSVLQVLQPERLTWDTLYNRCISLATHSLIGTIILHVLQKINTSFARHSRITVHVQRECFKFL